MTRGLIYILALLLWLPALAQEAFVRNNGQLQDQYGQANEVILYSAPIPGGNVHITPHGYAYDLYKEAGTGPDSLGVSLYDFHRIEVNIGTEGTIFKPTTSPTLFTEQHYIDPNHGISVSAHASATCASEDGQLQIEHQINHDGYKFNIVVANPVQLANMQLTVNGHLGLAVDNDGSLVIITRFGTLTEYIPQSYLIRNGKHHQVNVRYALRADDQVGFQCDASFKEGDTLVIDPVPHQFWSTYLGGTALDQVEGIDCDAMGNQYVTGFTQSTANFATSGSYQGTIVGSVNCFLIKYLPNGQKEWGSYFGGGNGDRCYALAYHDEDAVYVGATTFSTTNVVTSGAFQSTIQGADDAAIARFDATGSLLWCTYFGGDNHDFPARFETDAVGDLYITGHTRSTFNIATPGAYDETFTGSENGFLVKFSQGGFPMWGTYFGNGANRGNDVGLDAQGNIWIAGTSNNSSGIAGGGGFQPNHGGDFDGCILKFNANGAYQWGSFYGGLGTDEAHAIAVHPDGYAYVIGSTSSAGLATAGTHQPTMASIDDGFVARVNANGQLDWATYFGGEEVEYGYAAALDADGNIDVAGMTVSNTNVATPGAFQTSNNGEYDVLLMEFTPTGQLRWGTLWGGEFSDQVNDMAIEPSQGHILVGGITLSTTGMATPGALLTQFSGGQNDGFVARFCDPILPITALSSAISDHLCPNTDYTISVSNNNSFSFMEWNGIVQGPTLDFTTGELTPYSIDLSVVDTNGCPFTQVIAQDLAVVPEPPNVFADPEPYVQGQLVQFTTDAVCGTYQWSNGFTALFSEAIVPDTVCLICWDNFGCPAESCVEADITVGIVPISSITQFSYYVYAADGRLLATGQGTNLLQTQALLAKTYTGILVLRINQNGMVITKKIVGLKQD